MKAQFHPDLTREEEVDVLDIFVDTDGSPKMMFVRSDGHVYTAPINRFTNLRNGYKPTGKRRQPPPSK
ncbi:MAG: hypothetical protein ACOC9B_02515 [Chloroflexota bacterium]